MTSPRQALTLAFLTTILISCSKNTSERVQTGKETRLDWLENWFDAWELTSTEILGLPEQSPPIMFFYDKEYVYTTSSVSAPEGEPFDGPEYFSKKLPWRKEPHNDTLTIPNGQKIPIQHMTFAAPSESEDAPAFFVMAAPSFWQDIGLEDEHVGLEKMLTGIFLHEFTHTTQIMEIGARILAFERDHTFDFKVNDDIIQNYFINDSLYVKLFEEETALFYRAAESDDREELIRLTKQGLKLLGDRQENHLRPVKDILVEMDNVFLSMEGLGQYVMVSWLAHPKGGKAPKDVAIQSARRNRKWWSQDEGLALALVYEKLSGDPDWKAIIDEDPKELVLLIEAQL